MPRSLFFQVFSVLRLVLSIAGIVFGVGYLGIFGINLLHQESLVETGPLHLVVRLLEPSIRAVANWLPYAGKSYAALILGIAAWVIKSIVDSMVIQAEMMVRRVWKPAEPRAMRTRAEMAARYTLSADTERDREILLRRFRDIEKAIKTAARKPCTFLSIDVVGSTTMKKGERASAIAASFQAYEDMVRHIMSEYSVWKDTWTPDGVMACFLDRDLAVAAGQSILKALEYFNDHENHLRTRIQVRAGVNEGEVSIFEDTQLEKVADHAIDVAGHMQKHASEDGLQISDVVYNQLKDQSGFRSTGRNVDGFPTYEWTPVRSAPAPAPPSATPAT